MNILVIGGNRFFGKKLVKELLDQKHIVSILNRGNNSDNFGNQVERIICDRTDSEKMNKIMQFKSWDVIYDQVCFDYDTAKEACKIFDGRVENYIFTSSQMVYGSGENLSEENFKPGSHTFSVKETSESNYPESKRQCEVGFIKHANFPVTFVRFPVVLGHDDHTKRFHFHIDRINNHLPIYLPNLDAKISLISSIHAVKTLAFLLKNPVEGAINSASPRPISIRNFCTILEKTFNKKLNYTAISNKNNHSPYAPHSSLYLNTNKIEQMGLLIPEIEDWLPEMLIRKIE